ncbi:MAG: VWA domain-containing protein [Pikeienuella sp.]|uniref:VWA domain-containing protein n=1 Tax=Pikeienuella sp. TaxID=2831957 RepID=UPI00391C42D5
MTFPAPLRPVLAFAALLRGAGFAASPEQTESFIAAIGLLGPNSIDDIRRAARAIYGPGPEQGEAFDDLFDAAFLGRALSAPALGAPEEMPAAYDASGLELLPEAGEEEPSGADASVAERLFTRAFSEGEAAGLRAFSRLAERRLPRRRSRRFAAGGGRRADPRAAFREMMRKDGELTRLPSRRRRQRQRRVLLLIDVSGSMKAGTEGALRFGHALLRAAERGEAFTLGTRLTRVTPALRRRDEAQALQLASGLVADWDGGTRLGEALSVFLSVPRFAAHARGALAIVVSDGLERGGPEALVSAMERLRGLAHGLLWLSPLAADPAYRPETEAMRAILPLLDRLGDGSGPAALAAETLAFAKGARR